MTYFSPEELMKMRNGLVIFYFKKGEIASSEFNEWYRKIKNTFQLYNIRVLLLPEGVFEESLLDVDGVKKLKQKCTDWLKINNPKKIVRKKNKKKKRENKKPIFVI